MGGWCASACSSLGRSHGGTMYQFTVCCALSLRVLDQGDAALPRRQRPDPCLT